MNDFDIFDLWENDTPKSEFEKLSIEEAIEVKKRELLEKEEEEKREAARRKQELIQAKRDKEYKEYSAKVERLISG